MQFLTTALISLVAASPVGQVDKAAANPLSYFTNCSGPDAILVLESAKFTPNPLKKGELMSLTISGTLKEPITQGATTRNALKYGPFGVMDNTLDLCDESAKDGIPCPIPVGKWVQSKTFTVPGFAPGGKYDGSFEFVNADGKQIACLTSAMYF